MDRSEPQASDPPAPLISTNRLSRTTSTETETATQHATIDGTYSGLSPRAVCGNPVAGYRHSFQFGMGLAMINVNAKILPTMNFTVTGLGGPPRPISDFHIRIRRGSSGFTRMRERFSG